MQSPRERQQINQFLGNRGFAQMDEPGALVQQLAFCVPDHEGFRKALTKCEPQDRRDMYEAMSPHLRFTAKPLDVYMAEASLDAEARQLPVIAADGSLQAFRAVELSSDAYVIQKAIADDLAKPSWIISGASGKSTRSAPREKPDGRMTS